MYVCMYVCALLTNILLSTNSASAAEESARCYIYAFDLKLKWVDTDKTKFTISFRTNDDGNSVQLLWYRNGESEPVLTDELSGNVTKHVTYTSSEISLATLLAREDGDGNRAFRVGDKITWAVRVTNDKKVTDTQMIPVRTDYIQTSDKGTHDSYVYSTVDKYPSSPYFGSIYATNGRHTTDDATTSSYFYAYKDEPGTEINPYNTSEVRQRDFKEYGKWAGGQSWDKPTHLTVDSKGTVYMVDNSTTHRGIYTVSGDGIFNKSKDFSQFFTGTIPGPIFAPFIYGTGDTTKLYAYFTKKATDQNLQMKVGEYRIGSEYNIGSTTEISTSWEGAPSAIHATAKDDYTGTSNPLANILVTSRGMFIGFEQVTDNNNQLPFLIFRNHNGVIGYNSKTARDEKGLDMDNLNNSEGVGITSPPGGYGATFAITQDEKILVVACRQSFYVYDVVWSKDDEGNNTVALNFKYRQGHLEDYKFLSINFDYAGNLIASGKQIYRYALENLKAENRCETPAREEYAITYIDDATQSAIDANAHDAIFTNANGTNNWSDAANWILKKNEWVYKAGAQPDADDRVLINAPCKVDVLDAVAGSVDLHKGTVGDVNYDNTSLTILPGAALYVGGTIRKVEGSEFDEESRLPIGQYISQNGPYDDGFDDIFIKAGEITNTSLQAGTSPQYDRKYYGTGALAYFDKDYELPATVELCGYKTVGEGDLEWQHVAVPFAVNPYNNFYGSYMYEYYQNNWRLPQGNLQPFHGYLLLQKDACTYSMKGNLSKTKVSNTDPTKTIDLDYSEISSTEEGVSQGFNLLGNSWTAPLQVGSFTESDFTNAYAAIYLYNSARQYKPYPINQDIKNNLSYNRPEDSPADETEVNEAIISPLQAFFVWAKSSGATLKLDYDKLVAKGAQPASPLRSPERVAAKEQDRLYMAIVGSEGESDELYLFQCADYTDAFDNGYEALKMAGDAGTPYLSATTALGEMAVLAVPELDGTFLNFKQGVSNTYTITFSYNGAEKLYLEDAIASESVAIAEGATYSFSATDDDAHRFRIVSKTDGGDVATSTLAVWANDNNLFVQNPTGEHVQVCVYGSDGRLVLQKVTCELTTSLDIPMHGVYTIQLTTKNHVQTIKHIL